MAQDLYASAGVDTSAGDRAVELMKASVAATHGASVVGGVGGFAGLIDVSRLKDYRRPLLASATDGVGTKVALAQAVDRHDTIGQDLVAMVVDDLVVVGATPLAMTDYIACGKVHPERIAQIVTGIARACEATGTALVGGETAEHPGLLGEDDYDVAGAATAVVEADEMLGPERVVPGDALIAMRSSGLHSNGFSLVRRILSDRGIALTDHCDELGGVAGEVLLEPTRLYTKPLLELCERQRGSLRALSHITGGGIAANIARVLPAGCYADIDRTSWSPQDVFGALCSMAGATLNEVEGTWNLGMGMCAVVAPEATAETIELLRAAGIEAWECGTVGTGTPTESDYVRGAKGVDGGAVRLVGAWA